MPRQLKSPGGTSANRSRRNATQVDTCGDKGAAAPSASRRKVKEREQDVDERDDGTQPQCTAGEETDTESIDMPSSPMTPEIGNKGIVVTLLRGKSSAEDVDGMEVDVANGAESYAAAHVANLLAEFERSRKRFLDKMATRPDLKALHTLRERGLGRTKHDRIVGEVPGTAPRIRFRVRFRIGFRH